MLGAEHPDTLTSKNSLAAVLQDRGKYKEAEQLHQETLAGRQKMLGAEHSDTLTSKNDLANLLDWQRKVW